MTRITAADRLRRLLSLLPWAAANNGPTRRRGLRTLRARTGRAPERRRAGDDGRRSAVLAGRPVRVVVEEGRLWVHLSPSFDRSLRLTPEEALALVARASLLAVPGADTTGPLARGSTSWPRRSASTPRMRSTSTSDAPPGVLAAVQQATEEHRRLRLSYYTHSRDQHTDREVDPYRVHAEQGRWYLVGFDHLRARCDCSASTASSPRRARRLLRTTEGPARAGAVRSRCRRFDGSCWISPRRPAGSSSRTPWTRWSPPSEGRVRVTLPVSGRSWLERLLLQLGPAARTRRSAR